MRMKTLLIRKDKLLSVEFIFIIIEVVFIVISEKVRVPISIRQECLIGIQFIKYLPSPEDTDIQEQKQQNQNNRILRTNQLPLHKIS